MNAIGERIRLYRLEKGLTQEELGAILGVQKAAVQKIESGQTTNLNASKIRALCETFNMPPSYFLYDDNDIFWERVFGLENDESRNYPSLVSKDPVFLKMAEDVFGPNGFRLLDLLVKMNDQGIRRILSYTEELSEIEKYRRNFSETEEIQEKVS